jgi:hypothetical protein
MLILELVKTSDQAFAAAAFIGDWILAHGEDGLGDRAYFQSKMLVFNPDSKLVGVVVKVGMDQWRLLQ